MHPEQKVMTIHYNKRDWILWGTVAWYNGRVQSQDVEILSFNLGFVTIQLREMSQ